MEYEDFRSDDYSIDEKEEDSESQTFSPIEEHIFPVVFASSSHVSLRTRSRSLSVSTRKPAVFITRKICSEALQILRLRFRVFVWPNSKEPMPHEQLIKQIGGKDGLICMLTDSIDKQVLEKADVLRCVSVMSAGYDNLDISELFRRKIRIGYTPNVLSDATAELTVALLLATSRRILEASRVAKSGAWTTWAPDFLCGPCLWGSTVGIVGMGNIGLEVGKRLLAFNLEQMFYYDRVLKKEAERMGVRKVDFERLLSQSDFIIVCVSLNSETRHLFSLMAFKKMKKTAVFINTSRGDVVDQNALVVALKTKLIWGAGLDVTSPEPLPVDHELFKMKNCVILPHIGSATVETRTEMALLSANNVLCGLLGKKMPSELTSVSSDL